MRYYRGYWSNYDYGYFRPRLFSGGAIRTIIIINVAVYLFGLLFGIQSFFHRFFGLVPHYILSRGYIWQLATYMFVHGGFWHIFWNMFVLWMFGTEIENYWGRREFIKYYFITGIGAGIITFLFNINSTVPVVGASGAIYGILLAFGMMFPNRYIYFYFLIPIKAKYFVIFIGIMTFISSLSPGYSNISHLTHLGGLIIGYIYLKKEWIIFRLKRYTPNINFKSFVKKFARPINKSTKHFDAYDTDETLREEVDRILDKISKNGYDSLTDEEKKLLLLASEYFAKKDKK